MQIWLTVYKKKQLLSQTSWSIWVDRLFIFPCPVLTPSTVTLRIVMKIVRVFKL